MPIPFRVETIEQMKLRFPKALEKVWIPVDGMEDRPGLHREHVFDFLSGHSITSLTRQTIAREDHRFTYLHLGRCDEPNYLSTKLPDL
jgi:hypothetical protein